MSKFTPFEDKCGLSERYKMRKKIVQHYPAKWLHSLCTLSYISLYDLPSVILVGLKKGFRRRLIRRPPRSYFIRKYRADDGGLFRSKPLPLSCGRNRVYGRETDQLSDHFESFGSIGRLRCPIVMLSCLLGVAERPCYKGLA